ncbi:MAG: branched-chain amino acid ABC transporter permease [Deltaproteobacteria bacterium]|nr:branched-chain amino acid ABC transporter permease [Deltaproteobacteria bacterium]
MAMAIWKSPVVNKAFSTMVFFLQLLLDGVSTGFLYGISAVGLILIYRSGGFLNFAHGGMMAFGAFLFFALSVWADWPIILSFVVTLASSFTLGLILERCIIRPVFRTENLIHKILIVLGLALMLKGLLSFIFGNGNYHFPLLISKVFSFGRHSLQITSFHGLAFIAGIGLLSLYWFFFTVSPQGLSMRAFADNPPAARAMGVRINKVFALSWAIAALFCTVSGVALSLLNGLNADSLSTTALKVFPVILLGGINRIGGAILGGILIGLLETLTGGYISTSLQDLMPYAALILILIFKPSGLLGRKEQ